MTEIYCWAVYWKNKGDVYWHSRMTYPKLVDQIFTKKDALDILMEVSSWSTTIESRFETVMEGSEKHRAMLIQAGSVTDVINYTIKHE